MPLGEEIEIGGFIKMLDREKENYEGERIAVGIDPCKKFLQLAILSPKRDVEFRKLPLLPSITEEISKSIDPGRTQIAIESYASYGRLLIYELLKRGYDVREINPSVSRKLVDLFTEEHSDQQDAESFARALFLLPNLPKVSFSEVKLWLGKLSRLRKKLVKDLNGYLNRLHVALTESYGAVYKRLFRTLFTGKALRFFETYPTVNDALTHKRKVKEVIGEEKWDLLRQAGRWEKSFYLDLLGKEIRSLIRLIRVLLETKKEIYEEIRKIGEDDEEVRLLRSFPGIDYLTASTLLGEIGNIERFESESCLSSYCGVSPVMWQSGTAKIKTKRRKRFSRRLKGILYFISLSQIRINPESQDYYWRKRKEGKTHWQAMNALSRQLIKIIYYMLKNKEVYQRKQIVH
jgi:transposase